MNIQSYLPSKKVRIAIIILLFIGIGYFGFQLFQRYHTKQQSSEQQFIDVALVDTKKQNTEYYLDSDNDGAYDWQEALWPELDPHNPDSDNDGVLDGKYIKAKQAETQGFLTEEGELVESNLSESEKLGRSAYTALLAIVQSGGTIDDETEAQVSENIANYIRELELSEQVYTRDTLTLVENSKSHVYAYRDTVTDLFEKYPVNATDIELLLGAADNPSLYAGQLRAASQKYRDYFDALVVVETPFIIAGRHTELINSIGQISGSLDNLLVEEPDELVSLALLVQLENIMNQTADAIININTFFEIVEDESVFGL